VLHIASLIANPDKPALTDTQLAYLVSELPRAGLVDWLAPGVAAEIPFVARGPVLADALDTAIDIVGDLPVDLNIFRARDRKKRLLIADMDSTIIEQECIDELADVVGIKAEIAAITERAMRGEIAFEPALRERVALLKGIDRAAIARVLDERITLTPGAATLVRTMRAQGAYTALITGGFTLFAEPVARRVGFDEHRANRLEFDATGMTGRVEEPILGADAKRAALIELRDRLGLSHDETMAVGDGANDARMLEEAGLGVAFRAKPAVAQAAQTRVRHGDLTALLYLQGYRQSEFAA
jgi:phosphoserine phosphatase